MNKSHLNIIIVVFLVLIFSYFGLYEINCVEPHDIRTPFAKIPEPHSINTQEIPPKTKALAWVAFLAIGSFVISKYL